MQLLASCQVGADPESCLRDAYAKINPDRPYYDELARQAQAQQYRTLTIALGVIGAGWAGKGALVEDRFCGDWIQYARRHAR